VACRADPASALAIVPLGHAFDYRAVIPALGFIPPLDALDAPALLVAYGGMSPLRQPIVVYPPNRGPAETFPQPPLPPGASDVCVALDGVETPFLYEQIDVADMHPELADAPRHAPAPGQGRVIAPAPGRIDMLAWDAGRRLLWAVSTAIRPTWSATLLAVDPARNTVRRWPLPASPALRFPSATGSSQSIAVDAAGGVWFESSGYNLYRFDPATQRFRAVHLVLEVGQWRHFGSYVLAIVPYGSGVLAARRGVPWLTRYDASMRVVGTVPLDGPGIPTAENYWSSREVTRAGSNILVRGIKWFGLFDIHGDRIRQVLLTPTCTAMYVPSATFDDRRRAVVCDGDHVALLDQNGREVGVVRPLVDLPMEPLVYPRGSFFVPEMGATDWHDRWWYVLEGEFVEVDGA
jgi:hypothetical protein